MKNVPWNRILPGYLNVCRLQCVCKRARKAASGVERNKDIHCDRPPSCTLGHIMGIFQITILSQRTHNRHDVLAALNPSIHSQHSVLEDTRSFTNILALVGQRRWSLNVRQFQSRTVVTVYVEAIGALFVLKLTE